MKILSCSSTDFESTESEGDEQEIVQHNLTPANTRFAVSLQQLGYVCPVRIHQSILLKSR